MVRELEDDPVGYSPDLWKQLAHLDLIGLQLPEEFGGSGMSALESVVLYEEFGRSLAPSPHFVSAILSRRRPGPGRAADEQKASWLPRIVTGEAILTPAWLEPENGFGPTGVQVRAVADGDGFVLSGTKRHVAFAHAATAPGGAGPHRRRPRGGRPLPGRPTAPGVYPDPAADHRLGRPVPGGSRRVRVDRRPSGSAPPAAGWSTWDAVMHDGIILAAAQAVGGAQYAMDITVQYAKDRHQFDKPLGAFQALAHYLADATTAVDGAEVLVHEAAWARSEGRSVAKLAPMAKLFACQTFRDVTATAQQIFGGIGFTVEFDIQLYFRRAKQLQLSWWDTRYLEELVAAAVLDG